MKKAIIVTGTPGTGKTTLCKFIETNGYPIIDASHVAIKSVMEYLKSGKSQIKEVHFVLFSDQYGYKYIHHHLIYYHLQNHIFQHNFLFHLLY